MNRRFYYLLALSIYLVSCGTNSDDHLSPSNSIDRSAAEEIDSFFSRIQQGKFTNSFDEMLEKNPIIDLKDSLTNTTRNGFIELNKISGKLISYRLLVKKDIGNDIGAYSYLVKYQKRYYRFLFTFYNNGSSIRIYNFTYDNSIENDLVESLKLFLNEVK